ncbi:Flp pilus assembly protein CpaB [Pilimelia columellifera]|uniref:Flp pilus assembly protein RcpC/CpaB domain-containing protein n=1 Tax=Pilimelia columellifera subsp. columellifera TaxID=706583 RepID=A0ABN3NQU0_9ACTN
MKRRLLAVLVALLLAVVGCLAVVVYVRSADERAVAGRDPVKVLVAAKRIPAGTSGASLRAGGYVEQVIMPRATVPATAISELSITLDILAVTADIQPSQLLLRGMFGEPTKLTGGLALPEGKLAVSVEVSAAARVAGFVKPGANIAIFNTFTVRAGKGRIPSGDTSINSNAANNHATRVLLPRVEVIAVGEQGTPGSVAGATPSASDAPAKAKTNATIVVTVGVIQSDAERLIHAAQTGTLYLALLDDTATIAPGLGVDNNTLFP